MSNYQPVEYFNDRRGLAVRAGDEVAYAIRQGNTAELRIGVVTSVGYDKDNLPHTWDIQVKAEGASQVSHLWFPRRIVKVRTMEEIEAATYPRRLVFG